MLQFLLPALLVAASLTDAEPAGARSDTLRYQIVYQLRPAGELLAWRSGQEHHVFTEFNDRGRGVRTLTRFTLAADGFPSRVAAEGHDYWKNPVKLEIVRAADSLWWRTPNETGVRAGEAGLFLPRWDAYASVPLLARLALAADGAGVPILFDSTAERATIRALHSAVAGEGDRARTVTLHAIEWGGRMRDMLWLDESRELFAWVGWRSLIRRGYESSLERLIALEDSVNGVARRAAAESLLVRPRGPLVITNARLVDVERGEVHPGSTVIIRGNRIERVVRGARASELPGAQVIDAGGMTLLPGLWEMHGHMSGLDDAYGRRQLAQGVTAVRDLLSTMPSTHLQTDRRREIDAGREIGPRLVMAGFIDGPHPNAGPTVVLVDNEADARAAVRDYVRRGYDGGIKLYSSLDPALISTIVEEARQHGLRVGGHVPAFMTATQAIREGFGEINHGNFLILNFFGDTLDTRGTARFSVVAEQGHTLDLASPEVAAFVQLAKERDVVLDPTLCIFRNQLVTNATLPLAPGITREHHRLGFARMRDLVALMHRAGVRIVAGTDNSCPLAEELEIYLEVGMTPMQVLRMATLGAAESVRRDGDLGSVREGKLADVILVDGDPLTDMGALRKVMLVVKDGVPIDPEALRRPMRGP